MARMSSNFACNSPENISTFEIPALKLQRFQTLLNIHPTELRAKFGGDGLGAAHRHRGWALFRSRIPRSARQASCGGVLQH